MSGLSLWRVWRGRETEEDRAERLGAKGPQGALWIHGASNGELASARWVIEALAARGPVLVTASTVSGREMVRGWDIGVAVALAPLDLPGALSRFLAGGVAGFVNIEGEIWPRRFRTLARAGVPMAMIGARMSAKTAGFWERVGARFLADVDLVSAQDPASSAYLTRLGAEVTGLCDLKAEAVLRAPVLPPAPDRERVVLAASTHEGEEAPLVEAFLRQTRYERLILAPRHPRRGDAIEALLRAKGIPVARRSRGEALGGRVYLADTLGEMALWYAAAGVCFVGGSLVDRGGHTPWEPVRAGCAVLHGPHVGNFEAAYAALDAAGAARLWDGSWEADPAMADAGAAVLSGWDTGARVLLQKLYALFR
jgi:3-deoxy-D-manno-octulosonic-acid transferase